MLAPPDYERSWTLETFMQSGRQPWNGGGSRDLAEYLFAGLPSQDMKKYNSEWRKASVQLGTLCSGTDLCVTAAEALLETFGGSLKHKFSCDISPTAQRWIKQTCRCPDLLFNDITELPMGHGFDVLSQRQQAVPPCDWLYIGFSCKDVSHLNRYSTLAKSCVRDQTLRTGGTLGAAAAYVRRVQPHFLFLENVSALEDVDSSSGSSNAREVQLLFQELGYLVTSTVLDARDHGAVQRRTRWWAACVRVKDGILSDSDQKLYSKALQHWSDLLQVMTTEPAPLKSILMLAASEDLKEWQGTRSVDAADSDEETEMEEIPKKGDHANWPSLHAEYFRTHNFRWPPAIELLYNPSELKFLKESLSKRAQEIVAFWDQKFGRIAPGGNEVVIDTSQSIHRVPHLENGLPCVTPGSAFWLRRRFRRLEPNECLAAQGVPLLPFPVLAGHFSGAELQSLAGNAFNLNSCMAVTLATMIAFGASKL